MQNLKELPAQIQCKFCSNIYTPCRFNGNRQIYCIQEICKKKRAALRQKIWREKHADIIGHETERTAQYRSTKNFRDRAYRFIERKFQAEMRLFVAHGKTSAITAENMLLTMVGMLHFVLGGELQTSASYMQKHLEKCFEIGNTLNEFDDILTKYMEHIYGYDKLCNLS